MRRIIKDKNGEYWVQTSYIDFPPPWGDPFTFWRNEKGPFVDVQSARYAMQTGEVWRVVEGGAPSQAPSPAAPE